MWRLLNRKARAFSGRGGASQGFTLLELLVALSILSILATVLYLSVGASATQTRRIGRRIEEQQRFRLALQRIATDISGVFWDKDSAHLYFQGSREDTSGGRGDRLEFTSIVFHWRKPGERVDDLVTVSYSLGAGAEDEGMSLIREERPLTTTPPGSYGGPVAILGGVREVSFSYLDAEKRELDSWSTRFSGVFWDKDSAHLYFQGSREDTSGGRGDRLEFTSIVFHWRKPGERVDDLVTVSYSLGAGAEDEGMSLIREERPLTTTPPGSYGGPVAILGGVREVSFSYLDAEKRELDSWSTRSTLTSGQSQGLPRAVRVTLKLKRGEGERTVSVLIPLPLGLRPEENSAGITGAPGGS